MIKIVKEIITKDNTEYKLIHDEIFPGDPIHVAAIYYKVFKDNEYKGFVSGYMHDLVTFYIQRIGLIDIFRGKNQSTSLAEETWKHLKIEGWRFLMGTIETKNIPTIIVALKTGFIIHGFRVDTGGNPYVEIIKEL